MSDRDKIPAGPIGFRLANELEGLLVGISSDGIITADETVRLRRWMEENARFASVHPFTELDEHLTRVLADGVLTPDECEDLLFVVRKYTRVNPYFDQLRGGLQMLMGTLAGAAADSQLHDAEVRALSDWTEEWAQLRGLWPYDEISAIVHLPIDLRDQGGRGPCYWPSRGLGRLSTHDHSFHACSAARRGRSPVVGS